MTLAADLASDYAHVDGIETVTFTPKPTGSAVATAQADGQAMTYREAQLGGAVGLELTDVVWRLWSATLGGATPKTGDTITDSGGTVWTIVALTEEAYGATSLWFRCICRQQRA